MYLGTRTPPDIGRRKSGRIPPKQSPSTIPSQDNLKQMVFLRSYVNRREKGFLPDARRREGKHRKRIRDEFMREGGHLLRIDKAPG